METMLLVGADDVRNASHRMQSAAESMQSAAAHIENALHQRRQWEEEFLLRLEAALERAQPVFPHANP